MVKGKFCISFLLVVFGLFPVLGQTRDQHPLKLYTDSTGRLFAPRDMPLHFLAEIKGDKAQTKTTPTDKAVFSGILLNEGKNEFCNDNAFDSLGNKLGKTCLTIYVDGTPPKTSVGLKASFNFQKNDTAYYGENMEVSVSSADANSGVENIFIAINNSSFLSLGKINWDFKDQGYYLDFYAVDNVGNAGDLQHCFFIVDITSPVSSVSFSGNTNNACIGKNTMLAIGANDNSSGVKTVFYQIDDASLHEYKKPFVVNGLVNGRHKIYYHAVDNVGNTEGQKAYEFTYDTLPPELNIEIAGTQFQNKNNLFVSGKATVTISAVDSIAGLKDVEYKVGFDDWTLYTTPVIISGDEGMYSLKYRATDLVENRTKVFTSKIYIDNAPPETYYQFSHATFWRNDTVVMSPQTAIMLFSSDVESGLKGIELTINDVQQKNTDTIQFQKTGFYTLHFSGVDQVGNKEEKKQLFVQVDSSVQSKSSTPGIYDKEWEILDEYGLTGAIDLPYYIRISDSPDPEAPSYLLFVEDEQNPEQPGGLAFTRHGNNTLKLTLADDKAVFPLLIDGKKPFTQIDMHKAPLFSAKDIDYYGNGLAVSLLANDDKASPTAGVENIYYSVNGSGFSTYSDTLEIFGMEQEYKLRYYAIDSVKNMEQVNELSFVVDITPPLTRVSFGDNVFGNFISSHSDITFSSKDNLSGVDKINFSFDSLPRQAVAAKIPAKVINKLTGGRHVLYYYAKDRVENIETEHRIPVYVDHSPPEITQEITGKHYKKGSVNFINQQSAISISAEETATEVKYLTYSINGAAKKDYSSEIKITGNNGYYYLSCYCADMVGNANSTKETFYLDTEPPSTSLTFNGPVFNDMDKKYISSNTQVLIHARDKGAGIKHILAGTSPSGMKYYNKPLTFSGSRERRIYYYAIDMLQNREERQMVTVFVDDTPPSLEVRFNASPGGNGEQNVITPFTFIHIIAKDNVGLEGVFYEINDGDRQVYRKPISNFKQGDSFTLKAIAVDRLGNESTKILTFKVE